MRLVKVLVAALVALLISSMDWYRQRAPTSTSAPRGSRERQRPADQSREGGDGPRRRQIHDATVEPLTAVNANALGLGVPGTLTVGTLSDAPPSICINSAGQFTGFDNELLRAIADKLGLQINFVGTEFSGLLAQVASRASTSARRRSPPPTRAVAPSGHQRL